MRTFKKTVIVILHGWGNQMSGRKYFEIKQLLRKKGYTVFVPDFPGFGTTALDKKVLEFDDFVNFIYTFLQKNKIDRAILLGHSFGGRVAIRFSRLYPNKIKKLILTGASGIPRHLPSIKKKVVYRITKIIRPLFFIPPFSFFFQIFRKLVYYSIGEMDYYKAGKLSETFKNVYQVSVLPDLPFIKVPTLIVWGEDDTITPLEDGKTMAKLIPKAKLIVVKQAEHRLPYQDPYKFLQAIEEFL